MNNNYLAHHWIKGMKWGVRRYQNSDGSLTSAGRKRNQNWNRSYKKIDRSSDKVIYGNGGVKRINKRMNKGQSYAKAWTIELGRATVINTLVGIGTMDVITEGYLHRAAGKKIVDSYLKSKAAKAVVKIAQNHYYDPIDTTFKVI